MITEFVLFDLPQGFSRDDAVATMHEAAPKWLNLPDLVRKTFVYDPVTNQAGAFYLWENKAAAEAAHNEAWRQSVRDRFGSEPSIRYLDTPLVVDNALGRIIE